MTAPQPTPSPVPGALRDRVRARAGRADLLLFRIGPEYFATDLPASEEALELADHPAHRVPGRVATRLGVISVRGALLPLYSPRAALGLPASTELPAMAIVFPVADGRVAIAVDEVEDVFTGDLAELRDPPGGGRGSHGVLLGALQHGKLLVGLVDAEALLGACRAESIKAPAGTPGTNPTSALALETA